MTWLRSFLVPALVAVAMLAYAAYKDRLEGEMVFAVVVFLLVAAAVGVAVAAFERRHRASR